MNRCVDINECLFVDCGQMFGGDKLECLFFICSYASKRCQSDQHTFQFYHLKWVWLRELPYGSVDNSEQHAASLVKLAYNVIPEILYKDLSWDASHTLLQSFFQALTRVMVCILHFCDYLMSSINGSGQPEDWGASSLFMDESAKNIW